MDTIKFGSPKSCTSYPVHYTATVAAHTEGYMTIVLNVTNTSAAHPRNNSFYREFDVKNTTFTDALTHGTISMSIVPKLYGTDTVHAASIFSYKK